MNSIPQHVFHLAIPCRDLAAAERFYVEQLGCRLARKYPTHITLDFFQAQLVCHLCDETEIVQEPKMYPRHFGITFLQKAQLLAVLAMAQANEIPFYQELFIRFEGTPAEHYSFFLIDPSNNLLEFKHYLDPAMMY